MSCINRHIANDFRVANATRPDFYYYTKDHQGRSTSRKGGAFLLLCITQAALRFDYIAKRRKNVRSVVTKNLGTNEITGVQQTHYYPFGGIIANSLRRNFGNRFN